VIRKRLAKLEECLTILAALRRYSLDEFLADPEHYGSAERFLQLAIEIVNDLASHIIAERELGQVEASRDLPRLFRVHSLVDDNLEERWIRMIGFRNILVHNYLEVDRKIVFDVVQTRLDDLRALQAMFGQFL
jgi:uncharacterized protein YutE (UPF0331/DUF86 family)